MCQTIRLIQYCTKIFNIILNGQCNTIYIPFGHCCKWIRAISHACCFAPERGARGIMRQSGSPARAEPRRSLGGHAVSQPERGARACGGAAGPPATAHFRAGGEEECTRTGDTNPGCNYLVRGYSPSMHYFKPMTKYCPVFMLSLAGVQQDRNSGLARNYGAALGNQPRLAVKYSIAYQNLRVVT